MSQRVTYVTDEVASYFTVDRLPPMSVIRQYYNIEYSGGDRPFAIRSVLQTLPPEMSDDSASLRLESNTPFVNVDLSQHSIIQRGHAMELNIF